MLVLGIGFALFAQVFQGVSTVGTLIAGVDKIVSDKEIVLADTVYAPQFVRDLVVRINEMPKNELLVALMAIFASGFILWLVFEFLHSYFINKMSEKVMKDVRNRIFDKLMELSFGFYSRHSTGKLVSKITFDALILKNSITQGLMDSILQPAKLLIYTVLILFVIINFNISWKWIAIPVMLLPTIIYPVRVIGRRIKKITLKMQDKMGDINVLLHEAISGIRIVKAFLMEGYEKERFARNNANFYKITMKSIKRLLALRPITDTAGVLCAVLLMWLGKDEILSGTFSFGALAALLVALFMLLKPIKSLSNVYSIAQQALAASSRIFEILDAPPSVVDRPGAATLPDFGREISFEKAYFRYEAEDVLRGVDLKVRKGEIVAIVGSSGAGKTTLANLIPRFYDVTGGSLKIDGVDVRDVTKESLRAQIGVVTQDLVLFNDTVKFNIAYGRGYSGLDESRIIEAAKAANAHEFITALPEGYETIVGEKGVRLSGGQKQRIAIARAMCKNPPILILDEATSQLDTESERLVQEALNNLMKGRTVVVIAHRLSTIKHATRIVTLEGGVVKESGTHEELMEQPTIYRRLYELQFREY
jgi:subfamily B ATP-binding cassette protein MsbA